MYLLDAAHPDNGGKAAFFRGLGYDGANWGELASELIRSAATGTIERTLESIHGRKYVIEGWLASSMKGRRQVRTIWIIDTGDEVPRLVTAYPA